MTFHKPFKRTAQLARWLALLPVVWLAAGMLGCATLTGESILDDAVSPAEVEPVHPRLRRAAALMEAGNYQSALLDCVDVAQAHPDTPGLKAFQHRLMAAVQAREAAEVSERRRFDAQRMATEALQSETLPDRYGLQRPASPLPVDQISLESPMRERLQQPLTLQLQGVTLSSVIEALSGELDINLIADHDLAADKRITIEARDVPLQEVLRYIARNLDVEFHLGDHVIWITRSDASMAPMESRIYRLRRGMQMYGNEWGERDGDGRGPASDIGMLTHKATVPSIQKTAIETIIEKMVPEHPGAVLHFDRGAHALFVRNTRENLELIESIVEALDVTPPQVLIEARFIEVTVGDLRELGVEWMLGSPWSLSTKGVMQDGVWTQADRMQVGDASIGYTPFRTGEGGPHPLGPQGPFGLLSSPETASQGLNLTVEGILTQPVFEAVLHALEISGKGRTLSMPRVTTMNNNPAKLRSGEDLRYFEEFQAQAFSLVDADNRKYTITALIPKGTPSIEELGITLVAVPSVGADRQGITLLLNPSISSLDGFVSYQDDSISPVPEDSAALIRQVVVKLPVFTRQEVATKLTVQSGDTVVMGGLIRSVEQETVHKVPVLGDLPLLGSLFRRTGVTEHRKNLLIFVTATVISDRGESLVSPARLPRREPLELNPAP